MRPAPSMLKIFLSSFEGAFPGTWLAVIKAGSAYFAVVFFCAFLFGICRGLVLTPVLGKAGAVLVELPLVLAISWLSSTFLIARFGISGSLMQRLAMGALALSLTMFAEVGFSIFVFRQPLPVYANSIWNLAGLLGLSGQLGFALIPTVQRAFKRMQRA